MPSQKLAENSITRTEEANEKIKALEEQVATLEELLEVYQQTALAQAEQLEQALEQLQEHTQHLEHSEDALRVLKSMLLSMGDGVIVVDENGKFLLVNPRAEQIFPINIKEDTSTIQWTERYGLYLSDTSTPYPSEELPLVQAIQGETVEAAEMFVRNSQIPNGIWLSVNAKPLKDEHNAVQGGVAVFRDISKQKQSEAALREGEARSRQQAQKLEQTVQQLQKTQSQLIQTEKMSSLGQMVAGVAHEINNPVNFIHGNIKHVSDYIEDILSIINLYQNRYSDTDEEIAAAIEAVELDFLIEDLPNLLSSMKMGAERIRNIVLSMRNFSRMDEADFKEVNIHEGIDNTLLILNHRLKQGIEVIKKYGNLPLVECYPAQLNQVFMNILSNAIDALFEQKKQTNKQITISTEVIDNHQIQVRIGDNGFGIPEHIKDKLFDPFFTTKAVGKGTGLGLSICYEIMQKHQGNIVVSSEIGKGTEFIIAFPIKFS
ncbi:MAG TPA: ATP-binding protein [Oculatellaceae cyanobacterium]|jgi:signal transduction histidine kinase